MYLHAVFIAIGSDETGDSIVIWIISKERRIIPVVVDKPEESAAVGHQSLHHTEALWLGEEIFELHQFTVLVAPGQDAALAFHRAGAAEALAGDAAGDLAAAAAANLAGAVHVSLDPGAAGAAEALTPQISLDRAAAADGHPVVFAAGHGAAAGNSHIHLLVHNVTSFNNSNTSSWRWPSATTARRTSSRGNSLRP